MERFVTENVWSHIGRLIQNGDRKFAAIAYVSSKTPLSFGQGDVLICDASDNAIRCGETDAKTLRKFLRNGATIYSCDCLHAKTLISGNLVVVGSANLSSASENLLLEACLLTTRSQIRSQAQALIHSIMKASTLVDDAFIQHIISLPVVRRIRRLPVRGKPGIKQMGNRCWVVNTRPFDNYPSEEEKYVIRGEGEARKVLNDPGADINWIRWTGNSRFRRLARLGDTVIEITKYKHRATVNGPCSILVPQQQKRWTRFYLGEPNMKMSWSKFEREMKKVGLTEIKKTSVRELNKRQVLLMESVWQSSGR